MKIEQIGCKMSIKKIFRDTFGQLNAQEYKATKK